MEKIKVLSKPEEVSMTDQWYQYANENHFWMLWRFKVLQTLGGIFTGQKRILEIGCGNGILRKQIERNFPVDVDGCDLNPLALEKAELCRGQLFLYNIFDRRDEFRERYDSILLVDVLEHIEDEETFLNACLFNLKPGGTIILGVPALASMFSRYDEIAGHVRRYSRKEVVDLFKNTGLEPIEIFYWGLPLIPILALRKFMLLFTSREKNS